MPNPASYQGAVAAVSLAVSELVPSVSELESTASELELSVSELEFIALELASISSELESASPELEASSSTDDSVTGVVVLSGAHPIRIKADTPRYIIFFILSPESKCCEHQLK